MSFIVLSPDSSVPGATSDGAAEGTLVAGLFAVFSTLAGTPVVTVSTGGCVTYTTVEPSDGTVVGKGAELLIPARPASLIPAVGAGAEKLAEGVAGAAPIIGVFIESDTTGVVCAPAENCPTVAAKKKNAKTGIDLRRINHP
jgi:hypothetical protein